MSNILLSMIHDRATANKPAVEITAKNYQVWIDHWFSTANNLADEFDKEGLLVTADTVRMIIRDNARLIKRV